MPLSDLISSAFVFIFLLMRSTHSEQEGRCHLAFVLHTVQGPYPGAFEELCQAGKVLLGITVSESRYKDEAEIDPCETKQLATAYLRNVSPDTTATMELLLLLSLNKDVLDEVKFTFRPTMATTSFDIMGEREDIRFTFTIDQQCISTTPEAVAQQKIEEAPGRDTTYNASKREVTTERFRRATEDKPDAEETRTDGNVATMLSSEGFLLADKLPDPSVARALPDASAERPAQTAAQRTSPPVKDSETRPAVVTASPSNVLQSSDAASFSPFPGSSGRSEPGVNDSTSRARGEPPAAAVTAAPVGLGTTEDFIEDTTSGDGSTELLDREDGKPDDKGRTFETPTHSNKAVVLTSTNSIPRSSILGLLSRSLETAQPAVQADVSLGSEAVNLVLESRQMTGLSDIQNDEVIGNNSTNVVIISDNAANNTDQSQQDGFANAVSSTGSDRVNANATSASAETSQFGIKSSTDGPNGEIQEDVLTPTISLVTVETPGQTVISPTDSTVPTTATTAASPSTAQSPPTAFRSLPMEAETASTQSQPPSNGLETSISETTTIITSSTTTITPTTTISTTSTSSFSSSATTSSSTAATESATTSLTTTPLPPISPASTETAPPPATSLTTASASVPTSSMSTEEYISGNNTEGYREITTEVFLRQSSPTLSSQPNTEITEPSTVNNSDTDATTTSNVTSTNETSTIAQAFENSSETTATPSNNVTETNETSTATEVTAAETTQQTSASVESAKPSGTTSTGTSSGSVVAASSSSSSSFADTQASDSSTAATSTPGPGEQGWPSSSSTLPYGASGSSSGLSLLTDTEGEGGHRQAAEGDTFWPIVAALVIGIPSVIVFGIAITVIHRRRLASPARLRAASMYPSL